mgnify:CR=1 FL=1
MSQVLQFGKRMFQLCNKWCRTLFYMTKTRVALVDDDEDLRLVVSTYLETDGYEVLQAGTGAELKTLLNNEEPDIVLLDLMLAGEDGLALIPQIKQKTSAPIIVVSGKTDTTDRVVGLELGADDYITKPFEMRELSARVKANLRRIVKPADSAPQSESNSQHSVAQDKIKFGEWVLDTARLQIIGKQNEVQDLTKNEFDLLTTFLRSPNRALSREYLYDSLKEEDYNSFDRAIDVQVTRLRKKLDDDPAKPRYIKTIRGIGYMFIADV